ncbi:MAG: hypothetical protein ABIR31_10345 [Ginsengibacter sp.]
MKKITPIIFSLFILLSFSAVSLPKLSSFPSARATIFLDFDGQFVQSSSWNGGRSFYCTPSGMNDTQITEVFNRVSEDYRPFNVNITTDSTVFLSAPLAQRIRIIVTLTSSWYQNVGGVSSPGLLPGEMTLRPLYFLTVLAIQLRMLLNVAHMKAAIL